MTEKTKALVVHHNSETLAILKGALERQGMHIIHAESRAQAKSLLGGLNPVPLVFTETQLPDGTWADILAAAEKASRPVNVIVVARVVDTRFYVEAIETGAFDFLAPPFNATDLAYVVRTALDNAVARRAAHSTTTPSADEALFAEAREVATSN
ncbi:MAG: response regulator [Terriglobia bacterium]